MFRLPSPVLNRFASTTPRHPEHTLSNSRIDSQLGPSVSGFEAIRGDERCPSRQLAHTLLFFDPLPPQLAQPRDIEDSLLVNCMFSPAHIPGHY